MEAKFYRAMRRAQGKMLREYFVSSYATRHSNSQLYSTIAYYKILQYLCFTSTLGRPNPDYNENPKTHQTWK